jgi:1-acyl-sn-glycerol-3-phosphate acyltransferase
VTRQPGWLTGPDRFNAFMIGAHALTRALSHVLIWVTVEGLDRPLPRNRPLIVTANHSSALDAPLITGYLAPRIGRPVHWMVKQELMSDRLLGPIVRAYGSFGVQRGSADTDAYRTARAVLDAGRVLASHPEGTRSREGTLVRARPGLARLAIRSGAPILPVGVEGLERFLPRDTTIPRPFKRVRVRFGAPFTLAAPAEDADRREALAAATTEIMVRIGRLLPERQWGAYTDAIRASGALAGDGDEAPPEGSPSDPMRQ